MQFCEASHSWYVLASWLLFKHIYILHKIDFAISVENQVESVHCVIIIMIKGDQWLKSFLYQSTCFTISFDIHFFTLLISWICSAIWFDRFFFHFWHFIQVIVSEIFASSSRFSHQKCGLYGMPPCNFVPSSSGVTPVCASPGKTYCEFVPNYPV